MVSECGDESSTERETHGIAERGRVKHQRDSFALHQISLAAFFTLLFLAQPVLIHRKSRAFDVRLPWSVGGVDQGQRNFLVVLAFLFGAIRDEVLVALNHSLND